MSGIPPSLFDSAFLAKLEQLHLFSARIFRSSHEAEHKGRSHGSSLEFADHREYTPGDELRNIDWPAFARSERLFVKLFEQDQDLPITFLLDASASMRWMPQNSTRISKFDQVRKITAALAYIALSNLDAVNIYFIAENLLGELGFTRGKAQFHSLLSFLSAPPKSSNSTDILACVRTLARKTKRRGLVYLISDFFDPGGFENSVAMLRHSQFETHLIQVLDPAELAPSETGDLRLIEAETASVLELACNDAILSRYRKEIANYNHSLQTYCIRHGIGHASVSTETPFEDIIVRLLRDGLIAK